MRINLALSKAVGVASLSSSLPARNPSGGETGGGSGQFTGCDPCPHATQIFGEFHRQSVLSLV